MSFPRRRTRLTALSQILAIAICVHAGTVAVKWGTLHQVIEGYGASTAFNGSLGTNATFQDLLFDTTKGIGLTIIRVKVPARTDAVPTAYDVSVIKEALKRNPKIIVTACPWSPPASWKTNNNVNNGGELLPARYQDYANLLAGYAENLKTQVTGLHSMSVQNEPEMNVSYESCIWNATQYRDFVKVLKPAFTARNLTTKIMLGDSYQWFEEKVVVALNDPVTEPMIDIVSAHGYGGSTQYFILSKQKGKSVWETECSFFGNTNDPTMTEGLYWGENIHNHMTIAETNAWLYWNLVWSRDSEGLIQSDGTVNRRFWVLGNYSKFVRPGWVRIDATPANSDALVSAFKDTAAGKFAIVAINKNGSPASMTFNLDFATVSVTPNLTTETVDLKAQPAVAVTNGSFTTSLPARSVTTFTGVYDPNAVFAPQIMPQSGYFLSSMQITMACATSGAQIYYTTDGGVPTQSSTLYTGPFALASPGTIKAIAYKTGLQQSPVATAVYQPLRTPENPTGAVQGLAYSYYEGSWTALPNFTSLNAVKTGSVANFDISAANRADNFGFQFIGYVNIPSDGIYTFATASDDGSRLYIGTTLVANNDGGHAVTEASGQIGLQAGKHAIRVEYFEAAGGQSLAVKMNGQAIAAGSLFRLSGTGVALPMARTTVTTARELACYNIFGQRVGSARSSSMGVLLFVQKAGTGQTARMAMVGSSR